MRHLCQDQDESIRMTGLQAFRVGSRLEDIDKLVNECEFLLRGCPCVCMATVGIPRRCEDCGHHSLSTCWGFLLGIGLSVSALRPNQAWGSGWPTE